MMEYFITEMNLGSAFQDEHSSQELSFILVPKLGHMTKDLFFFLNSMLVFFI